MRDNHGQNNQGIGGEILGYEIDTKTEYFSKKVMQLVDSIENSVKKAKVFLNTLRAKFILRLKAFLQANQWSKFISSLIFSTMRVTCRSTQKNTNQICQ